VKISPILEVKSRSALNPKRDGTQTF